MSFEERSRVFQFTDKLTWQVRAHSIKFGTDIRRLDLKDFVQFIGADDFGVFQFNGQFSGIRQDPVSDHSNGWR